MRLVTRCLFAVACLLQLTVLYLPTSPGAPAALPQLDKLVHLVVFAAPVCLGILTRFRAPVVVGLFAAHAVASELVQHLLLPRRSGDPFDLASDLLGIGLGWAAATAWSRRRKPAPSTPAGRPRP